MIYMDVPCDGHCGRTIRITPTQQARENEIRAAHPELEFKRMCPHCSALPDADEDHVASSTIISEEH